MTHRMNLSPTLQLCVIFSDVKKKKIKSFSYETFFSPIYFYFHLKAGPTNNLCQCKNDSIQEKRYFLEIPHRGIDLEIGWYSAVCPPLLLLRASLQFAFMGVPSSKVQNKTRKLWKFIADMIYIWSHWPFLLSVDCTECSFSKGSKDINFTLCKLGFNVSGAFFLVSVNRLFVLSPSAFFFFSLC